MASLLARNVRVMVVLLNYTLNDYLGVLNVLLGIEMLSFSLIHLFGGVQFGHYPHVRCSGPTILFFGYSVVMVVSYFICLLRVRTKRGSKILPCHPLRLAILSETFLYWMLKD